MVAVGARDEERHRWRDLLADGTRVMAGDAGISAVKIWDLGPERRRRVGEPSRRWLSRGEIHARWTARRGGNPIVDRALTIWDLQTGRDLRTIGPATDVFGFLHST